MEEFHAMTIYVDKEIDNQETLELIKDWLNAQDPSNTSWFDEDENPLACGADDERSPELNDAIRSHYGALNIF